MSKTLSELFSKYTPSADIAEFFGKVNSYTVSKSRIRQNVFEIQIELNQIIPKALLYKAEEEIRVAYDGNYLVRFVPSYPQRLFGYDYISQIILEAERIGGVARGFFTNCDYNLSGSELTFFIPFSSGAIDFLTLGKLES